MIGCLLFGYCCATWSAIFVAAIAVRKFEPDAVIGLSRAQIILTVIMSPVTVPIIIFNEKIRRWAHG